MSFRSVEKLVSRFFRPSQVAVPDDVVPGQVVASDDEFDYVVKRFGDLEVGDEIPDDNDDWETVVEVYDEHLPESMYEVTTDEGQVVEVSGNHLWYVETSLDRSLHAHRLKNSAKVLQRCLSEEVVEAFEMIATDDDNEYLIETMLKDMIELSESRDPELLGVFSRIAESVGHVSENNVVVQDLETGEQEVSRIVRGYDARRFAQQVLALTGIRKYRSQWPVIVGRIVTTEEIIGTEDRPGLMEFFEVFIPSAKQSYVTQK